MNAFTYIYDMCKVNIISYGHKSPSEILKTLALQIREAVSFLHNLGSVQHFRNEYLKTRVVIDPQWIVDAMACVVSVHDTPIIVSIFTHMWIQLLFKIGMKNSVCHTLT